MILTREEYRSGFISFDGTIPPGGEIAIWTATTDDPSEEAQWAGPYTNPAGAKVSSPPKRYYRLKMGMSRGPDPHQTPILTKVRWERDGVTAIWPGPSGFNGPPGHLVIGRDLGCSYRLVLKPKNAYWPESVTVLDDNFRVRLWKEPIKGFAVSGFSKFQPSAETDKIEMFGELAMTNTQGDVVEVAVTVPGDGEAAMQSARNQAESLLGFVAFNLGEGVTGEPVIEEYSIAGPEGELGEVRIPVRQVEPATFILDPDVAALGLGSAAGAGTQLVRPEERVYVALRWMYKGYTSTSLVDAFLAFIFGLEVLAAGWFASLRPTPVRQDYSKLRTYFDTASASLPSRLVSRVLARLSDFPLEEKLERYWHHHSLHAPAKPLGELVGLRNKIAHGAVSSVESRVVAAARDALKAALSAELGFDPAPKVGMGELFELKIGVAYVLKAMGAEG